MSPEDIARCQEGIDLANAGNKEAAYEIFYDLYDNNTEDTTLLTWLAYTTPEREEAQHIIAIIERLEPGHPKLSILQKRVSKMPHKPHRYLEMTCPYCHYTGPIHVKGKIAVGGWIWFAVCFLGFIGLLAASAMMASTVVPEYLLSQIQQNINSTEGCSFFLLLLSFVGFFIRKRRYVCGSCGIALGDMT